MSTNSITPSSSVNSASIVEQPNYFSPIPIEVIIRILASLPSEEIGPAILVCKEWCQIFEQNDGFRSIFRFQFPNADESTIKDFKKLFHFYSNLTKKICVSHTFVKGDYAMRDMSVAGAGERLILNYMNTIKNWDIHTERCITTFRFPTEWPILTSAIAGEMLIAQIFDANHSKNSLKALDIKTGDIIAEVSHESVLSSPIIAGERLFSISPTTGTIKVWDFKTMGFIATLQGDENGGHVPSSLAADEKTLFAGFTNGRIKTWDIKTCSYLATFEVSKDSEDSKKTQISLGDSVLGDSVLRLVVVGERLFSTSGICGMIKIWDIKTGHCIGTLKGHSNFVTQLEVIRGTLLLSVGLDSKSLDCTIKVWDVETRCCIATWQEDEGLVSTTAVAAVAGEKFFISSNGSIKSWNFTATPSEIYNEIAQLLEEGTPETTQRAFELFSKMPIRARTTICTILHDILDDAEVNAEYCTIDEINERSTKPEDIFYGKCKHRSATSKQKIQAIQEYLFIPSLHQSSSSLMRSSATGKRANEHVS